MKPESKAVFVTVLMTVGLFLSGFFVYFTPLPAIYYHLKYRKSQRVNPVWIALLLLVVFYVFGIRYLGPVWLTPLPMANLIEWFSPTVVILLGVSYFLIYVGIALAVPIVLNDPRRIFFHSTRAVLIIFFVMGTLLLMLIWPKLELFREELKKYLLLVMEQIISNQEKQGMDLGNVITLRAQSANIVREVVFLIPFSFFFYITFLYAVNLTLAKQFFALHFKPLQEMKLTLFRPPFALVWCCIAALSVLILNEVFFKSEILHFLTLNLILGLSVIYLLQGVAIFIALLNRWKIFGLLRFLVFFLVFATFYFSGFLFVALGFFDSWLDLRKLERKAPDARTS